MYGVSLVHVDNSKIQEAIRNNASKDTISYLKMQTSWEAVYGFEYYEVEFNELSVLLSTDVGFTPFKYASIEEGAIYNIDKHPNAYGRIRGRANVNNTISWICLDIDDTDITDEEMHLILGNTNHHISRTSDKDNKYKYRILIQLSKPTTIEEKHWKPFLRSIARHIGIKIDTLGRSQVFYGYNNRKVYSTLDKGTLDPSTHLNVAYTEVAELEEKRANAYTPGQAQEALQSPYSTFGYAYDAEPGSGTTMMLGAISQAKELGASSEYIEDLLHAINKFWDHPMPEHRLQSTVMTAI